MNWMQILDDSGKNKWTGHMGTLFAVGNGISKSFLVDKDGNILAIDLRKEELVEQLDQYPR